MTTAVKRKAKIDPASVFQEHIVLKTQGAAIVARAEALKTRLKDAFADFAGVYSNENGSLFFDFEETISDGKNEYKGMEKRRSVPIRFDEEVAERILKAKGVYDEALTPVIDQDKIYRLQAEGKITDKDIDKMFSKGESWAFYPVKGEVL